MTVYPGRHPSPSTSQIFVQLTFVSPSTDDWWQLTACLWSCANGRPAATGSDPLRPQLHQLEQRTSARSRDCLAVAQHLWMETPVVSSSLLQTTVYINLRQDVIGKDFILRGAALYDYTHHQIKLLRCQQSYL